MSDLLPESTCGETTAPPAVSHPLLLVSGFLGAGKTTFIEGLIPLLEQAGVPVSLILNDYENAEVDTVRLRPLVSEFTALTGSCVCCDTQLDFFQSVASIPVAPGGVLIIEANGTTDMTELISLLASRNDAARFRSPLHAAQVDVRRWQKRGAVGNEIERWQLQTATHLCCNRAEDLPKEEAEETLREIRWQAPVAKEITTAELAAKLIALAKEPPAPAPRRFRVPWDQSPPARLDPLTGLPARSQLFQNPIAPQRPDHTHFTSFSAELPPVVEKEALIDLLMSLPENVARVKGLVRFRHAPETLVNFQHVRPEAETLFVSMPGAEELYQSLGGKGGLPPVAVVVGAWLDTAALEAAFSTLPAAMEPRVSTPPTGLELADEEVPF